MPPIPPRALGSWPQPPALRQLRLHRQAHDVAAPESVPRKNLELGTLGVYPVLPQVGWPSLDHLGTESSHLVPVSRRVYRPLLCVTLGKHCPSELRQLLTRSFPKYWPLDQDFPDLHSHHEGERQPEQLSSSGDGAAPPERADRGCPSWLARAPEPGSTPSGTS